MTTKHVLIFLVTLAAAATGTAAKSHAHPLSYNIHLLRHRTRVAGRRIPYVNCMSWRLGVEANNIREWPRVPQLCEGYVGHYMLGRQYRDDCAAVAAAAIRYVSSVELGGDGKDVWIFDIDETALSNLPYYARVEVGFGARKYNETRFHKWIKEGKAPAMPATLRLYRKVLSRGIKPVFISATKEDFRLCRISNLKRAGFRTWEMLILRDANDTTYSAIEYKSEKRTELVNQGFRIVGNIGDQWSDLLGENVGLRTFKMPDPMYYIA